MLKIITISFNPAIDKSTTVPVLIAERKLKCTAPVYEPGGGGINVARAIKKLGGTATAIYLAGGYTGKALTKLLQKEAVPCLVAEINENSRENLIVLETSTNRQYRFGMPGPSVVEQEWQQCLAQLEQVQHAGFIVVSGALSPGVPTAVYAKIASIARSKKVKVVVDTSGDALKEAVQAGVYLIKPNLEELRTLAGMAELNIEQVEDAARQVISTGKCEVIVVSMGAAGAMLVTADLAIQMPAPSVTTKSTVGAGDSMVAGMVLSLAQNKNIIEAVQYGVACGTAATMHAGTELCRKKDADHLFQLMRMQ